VCQETKDYLRDKLDKGIIASLYESTANINSCAIMRVLSNVVDEIYFAWFDDDRYITSKGWDTYYLDFINRNHDFSAAGHLFTIGRSEEYKKILETSKWWKGWSYFGEEARDICYFAVGGFRIINAPFIRRHNFPDFRLVKKNEDMLLADLCQQRGHKMIPLANHWKYISQKNEDRRGVGEGDDGWKNVDPITGINEKSYIYPILLEKNYDT
jgi:hypothetical protein